MRVTIIGSGNVGTILGRRILQAGHTIHQVFSRTHTNGSALADELFAKYVDNITDVDTNADLYIICVADNAIDSLRNNLNIGHKLVAHTAGSVSMNVLEGVSPNFGVIYPLQSLRKELKTTPAIPIFVDGNNEGNKRVLFDFAKSFADSVDYADDVQRSKLHLAAVISNNFSNYLFRLAEEYCKMEGVPFKAIVPLLHETVHRLNYASPAEVQTGPAIRKDTATIERHLEMLRGYAELRDIYDDFSRRILTSNENSVPRAGES